MKRRWLASLAWSLACQDDTFFCNFFPLKTRFQVSMQKVCIVILYVDIRKYATFCLGWQEVSCRYFIVMFLWLRKSGQMLLSLCNEIINPSRHALALKKNLCGKKHIIGRVKLGLPLLSHWYYGNFSAEMGLFHLGAAVWIQQSISLNAWNPINYLVGNGLLRWKLIQKIISCVFLSTIYPLIFHLLLILLDLQVERRELELQPALLVRGIFQTWVLRVIGSVTF